MTQKIWTDQELQDAAEKVREKLLNSVPPPSQCPHEFSLPFQTGIEKIKCKKKKHETLMSALTKIAAILLVVILGIGVWVRVSPDSWAAVQTWVAECYENSIIYRFLNARSNEVTGFSLGSVETAKRHIGWLPDGYEESDDLTWADVEMTKYVNKVGDTVYLSWCSVANGIFNALQNNEVGTPVQIGGGNGVFIEGESKQNELVWVDADGRFSYQISGPFSTETMIKMAESIY